MKRSLVIKIIVALNLIIVLAVFNWQMRKKETILSEGKLVYLELQTRDPRSLMQGDYMHLNYALINDVRASSDSIGKRGFCIVTLNDSSVAGKARLQQHPDPLYPKEYRIRYFSHMNTFSLGAESFFFEEGTGDFFTSARYGGIRVDKDGNSVLVGLYDSAFKKIVPSDSIH